MGMALNGLILQPRRHAMAVAETMAADGPDLPETALVGARGEPGRLAEGRRERTGLAVTNGQSDVGHRVRSGGEKLLGVLHPAIGVVAVRRNAERLLERPAEVVGAEPHQLGEAGEGNGLS